jgi:2-succinyl-6-hydroxy-2,4-cyclohexadiene-1-carboxylate synthase
MLHGFTGSPTDVAALAAMVSPGLAQQVLSPPLGGHLAQPASASFDEEVERLAALAPGATRLFGYSLGGRLVLGLIARYPNRFERAVVVSAHPGLCHESERLLRRAQDQRWIDLLRDRGMAAFVAAWERQALWRTQQALPDCIRAERRRTRGLHTTEGLASCLESVGLGRMRNLRPQLARSSCAVDLLAGSADAKFLSLARELQQLIPRSTLSVAEDAGHDLVLERPGFCSTYLAPGV